MEGEITGGLYSITSRSERTSLTYRGIAVGRQSVLRVEPVPAAVLDSIRQNRDSLKVLAVSPSRIDVVAINGSKSILVSADLNLEKKVKSWWKVDGAFPGIDGELVVGSKLADKHHVEPGTMLSIEEKRHRGSGVLLATGHEDDDVVFLQNAGIDHVDVLLIESALPGTREMEKILNEEVPDSMSKVEITRIDGGRSLRYSFLRSFVRYSTLLSGVLVILGALLLYILGMSSVNDRAAEFAVFRSMGYRKSKIALMIALELGVFCIASVVAGNVTMTLAVFVLAEKNIPDGFSTAHIPFFRLFSLSLICTVAICVISAMRPVIKAINMNVVNAFRKI